MEDNVEDNTKLFDVMKEEISDMNKKLAKMNDINQTLNQLISELHEASTNEMKVMKQEMEAMKANKVMKDNQLNMLYAVMESHINIDVHAAFNKIEVKTAEDRRVERERRLAEEATQKNKSVIEETQEAGGSSSQIDVEMTEAEVDPQGFVLIEEDEDDDKSDKKDDKDDKKNDDDDQGSSGLLIENPNEVDLHQEACTSGKQHVDQVFLTNPTVIYLHAQHEGELEVPRSRAKMLEELGLDDGKFKFDIEYKIPESAVKEYEFVYTQEGDKYDEVIVEEASDSSVRETDFHYSGVDETFPSFAEMFKDQNEDEIRGKIVEKISTEGVPKTIPRANLAEERKKWFKVMPKKRKYIRPLQYFTHNKDISWGDILSWGYLEDLQVYAIRREQGVQYFEFLSDIKTLSWWDVDELVKQHDQHLWNYVKLQAKAGYPDWKPHCPKQIVTLLENGEKDITLDVKPPRCLKSMPLRAMEQEFYEEFQGWLYNPSTAEVVISLFDESKGESRRICILDPMWLVNCSKKDIDCLFYNKIVYEKADKEQAMLYQKIVDSNWRDLEIDEFLKKYKREQRFKAISDKAAKLGKLKFMRPPPTDQTPIEKEENKIPKWDRKRDGDPVYRKWCIEKGRHLRRKMLDEKAEQRRQRAKE
ncbi:hypothetical protein Hanom_Chr04g00329021 [Helianthus anomalus]